MKKILSIVISFLLVTNSIAQKEWSYTDCIDYAMTNNLNLKNYEYNTQSHKLNYKSAIYSYLPEINATIGYGVNQGKSTDPNTNDIVDNSFFSNSNSIESSLLLFNGFRRQNLVKYEKYRLTASIEEYEKQKNDIAFRIINAYITHLINSGLADIQKEQLELSEKEVYRINKRIELGLASGGELYEAEAQRSVEEYRLVQYNNLVNTSISDLKRLMNFPSDSVLVIQDIDIGYYEYGNINNDSIFAAAKNNLPEVRSTIALLQSAKKQVKAAQSSLSPSLSAYASWNTGYYETSVDQSSGEIIPFNDQISNNRNISIGLSLNIPLFNRLQRKSNIQQAKIAYKQAENNLQITFREIEYNINQTIMDWQGAIAEFNAAQNTEESMQQAFKVAEKKREKGLISTLDFYEAKNNLSSAKAEMLRTELQLFLMKKTIYFYLTGSFTE